MFQTFVVDKCYHNWNMVLQIIVFIFLQIGIRAAEIERLQKFNVWVDPDAKQHLRSRIPVDLPPYR